MEIVNHQPCEGGAAGADGEHRVLGEAALSWFHGNAGELNWESAMILFESSFIAAQMRGLHATFKRSNLSWAL